MRWLFLLLCLLLAGAGAVVWLAPWREAGTDDRADRDPADEKLRQLNVFFGNSRRDPDELFCDRVYPVERRVISGPGVARAALEELLKGPTAQEAADGYFSSLNEGVRIRHLAFEDGVVRADFSGELDDGVAGSCRVEAIRAQIIQTLLQFPNVADVIISVEGEVEQALQP